MQAAHKHGQIEQGNTLACMDHLSLLRFDFREKKLGEKMGKGRKKNGTGGKIQEKKIEQVKIKERERLDEFDKHGWHAAYHN